MKKKKIIGIGLINILIIALIFSIIIVSKKNLIQETEATSTKSLNLEFSDGKNGILFDYTTKAVSIDSNSGYLQFPETFSSTVSIKETGYNKKVDNETYYFSDNDYSYTFTGWKIVGQNILTPSKTVFQPGDRISSDYLKTFDTDGDGIIKFEAVWGKVIYLQNPYDNMKYTDYWILDKATTQNSNKTGAWNYKYENGKLTLNDGKDINNPLSTLDYAYYKIYQLDYANGFSNAKSHNSYEYVIMLTGDLDYIKSSSNGKNQSNYFTKYDVYNGTYDNTKHYIFGECTAQQGTFAYSNYYSSNGAITTNSSVSNSNNYTPSVTFKSCQANTSSNYTFYFNGYGYFDTIYNSIRFDNINFSQSPDSKKTSGKSDSVVSKAGETAFAGKKSCYVEFSNRSATTVGSFTLRPNALQTAVINGGKFSSWQTSWSSSQNGRDFDYDIEWYIGDDTYIYGDITLGNVSPGINNTSTINQGMSITITGGRANNIYGASAGMLSKSNKTRKVTIIGDKGSNSKTNPNIKNVYGAGKEGALYGDTYVTLKGCTNLSNVYGGGYAFTATTYGNVNVDIENSYVSGNVFGGGLNGNVQKDSSMNRGNVTLNIKNSEIKGNIFGSGTGGTQTLNTSTSIAKYTTSIDWKTTPYYPTDGDFKSVKDSKNGDYSTSWDWDKHSYGFPYIQKDTNYICVAIYKRIVWTSNSTDAITFERDYTYAYLSVAVVEGDVNINIASSKIGTEGNKTKGNIYGGGSVAEVEGNTYVNVKNNSTIYGSIYGGGDGATKPTAVTVYKPIDTDKYVAPSYSFNKTTNTISITNTEIESKRDSYYQKFKYTDGFNWSSESYLTGQNGIDETNHLIYSPNVNSLGIVKGNTNVTVEDSSVTENVFAGGNAADVSGKTNVIVNNSSASNIYGGGNEGLVKNNSQINLTGAKLQTLFGGGNSGDVEGDVTITIKGLTTNSIYGGGNAGNIKGNVILNAEGIKEDGTKTTNLYGGGYSGNIEKNVTLNLKDCILSESFGGGYSGYVGGNSTTEIISGTYKNVFAGGDQSYVSGNTILQIGDDSNSGVNITGLSYGGGRGKDEDGDGDSSNVTTVYGSSEVTIQGTKTAVQNYGSVKLGAVAKDVNVTFKDYWTGNATAKYKEMNGIDRATTVKFDNSYVLLENKNSSGELEGIKAIKNLIVPSGSGLKISANGEITGDFTGGGELYLDSEVCLTVEGNITGQTKLILNPVLYGDDGQSKIKGGINFPYFKVKGNAPEATDKTQAIISGEDKYIILQADKDKTSTGYTHYYITNDIVITSTISVTSQSEKGRIYSGDITNTSNVIILNNDSISSKINLNYDVSTNKDTSDKYEHMSRKFVIKEDKSSNVTIPAGTEITMIINDTYYFYNVSSNSTEIPLSNFKTSSGNNYNEITDFSTSDSVTRTSSEVAKTHNYKLDETFRFIVNFENTITPIESKTYYPSINVFDNSKWLSEDQNDSATNVVQTKNRKYSSTLSSQKEKYLNSENISINGKITIDELKDIDIADGTDLYAKVSLQNSNNQNVDIPFGTIIKVNDTNYDVQNGVANIKIIEGLNNKAQTSNLNITINNENVFSQYELTKGTYNLIFDLYTSSGDETKSENQQIIIPINIVELEDNANYGLNAEITNSNIQTDKLQLIENTGIQERTINLKYQGTIENAKIKIKTLEKTGSFEYSETSDSKKIKVLSSGTEINELSNLSSSNNLTIKFPKGLNEGTYRIVFELYDSNDNKITQTYLNFIELDKIDIT